MYSKLLLPLLLFSSFFLMTCKPEDDFDSADSNPEWFVFGVINCASCSDCSRLYKIDGNRLLRQKEHGCMLDTISFPKDPLPASKFAIAKEFMDAMPPDFFEIPENQFEYFGPLWGDQVYTIQIARGGQIKTWTFSVVGGWDIGWFPYVDYWIKLYNTIDKLE